MRFSWTDDNCSIAARIEKGRIKMGGLSWNEHNYNFEYVPSAGAQRL